MISLYSTEITNDLLLSQKRLRHQRFNLDYEYISGFPHENFDVIKNIRWNEIDFNKPSVNSLNNNQGIYMFGVDPYSFSITNHNANLILYVGQARDLKSRILSYFRYPDSKIPSDQDKRFFTLFFADYLKVYYYETINLSQIQLDNLEYSIIDSLLPPYNKKIHSQFAQGYLRLI